jgi:hypothetical protein
MGKVVGGQAPFKILVANLAGGSDPSRGAAFNPVKTRVAFTMQHFVEVGVRGGQTTFPTSPSTPGLATRVGYATYTVANTPVRGSGTITVASNTFLGPTTVTVGEYTFLSGSDFSVSGAAVKATASATVLATPCTSTLTVGGVALTPAGGARTPGNNDYDNTLGTVNAIMLDLVAALNDPANAFAATITATAGVGGAFTLEADTAGYAGNAITLASSVPADLSVSGATFSGGLDTTGVTAISLAAAIDTTPEYSATATGDVVTVEGLTGPLGNEVAFYAGGASPNNFTFSPMDRMAGAEPYIGPVVLTP